MELLEETVKKKIALNFQTTDAILSFGPINEWMGFYLSNVIYFTKATESY